MFSFLYMDVAHVTADMGQFTLVIVLFQQNQGLVQVGKSLGWLPDAIGQRAKQPMCTCYIHGIAFEGAPQTCQRGRIANECWMFEEMFREKFQCQIADATRFIIAALLPENVALQEV